MTSPHCCPVTAAYCSRIEKFEKNNQPYGIENKGDMGNDCLKNILFILPFNPYPLTSGGHQAIYNNIAILKDVANVYIMLDVTESQWKRGHGREIEQVLPFVKVVPFVAPESRHTFEWYYRVLKNKIAALFPRKEESEREYEVYRLDISGISEIRSDKVGYILQCIKKLQIDIVQVEMVENLRLIESLPTSVRRIFIHHELRFVRDELLARRQGGVLSKEIKDELECNKKEEIRLLDMYDSVVTYSSADTQKLLDAGVKAPIITSVGIICGDSEFVGMDAPIRKVLSYVGPECHYPNYDGVMWFLENCWNKLISLDSEYRLQIIGKWSEKTANYLAETYKGVRCLGFIENLAEVISGTTMIVPLNIGSGIRMKILEAAHIGVPVVSTTVGAEGLPLIDGEHVFIADDPAIFVDDIIKLQNEQLRNKFVKNIRNTIEEKYSLEALKASRIRLYE